MEKQKITIRLGGHDYQLVTDQEPEKMAKIARYVDQKIREISMASHASDSMVLTLTSMTLAEELFACEEENVRLKREILALGAKKTNRE